MKRYKFEMGAMFTFYYALTLGEALELFIKDRPNYVRDITAITEEPYAG